MMKKQIKLNWIVVLFLAISPSFLFAQSFKNKILMTLGDRDVTVKEFMDVYEKNNINTNIIDKKNVEDYLDLYIDFKLKVIQAEELKMDTNAKFIKELTNYRKQLAKPYFSDDEITKKLVEEAYERMQYDINAAHILVKCDADALPADTLIAYEKIMKLRKRIINGEDFGEVAVEASDDPSARDMEEIPGKRRAYKGNRGELGYFTVFDMVYPFETGAYNTKVGKVSMPIRSDLGYHLIKINSKTPASGMVKAAHIFLVVDPNDPNKQDSIIKNKIDNIYKEITPDGSNWDEMVNKYTDDKGTVSNGGQLSIFKVSSIVPEFISVIKTLKPGEISKPVKTSYGYHIIKLIKTQTPGSFDDEKDKLKERVEKDMRSKLGEEIVMKRIMKENKFIENSEVKDNFINTIDSTLTMGKYKIAQGIDTKEVLFTISNRSSTIQDFINYIFKNQSKQDFLSTRAYAHQLYEKFLKKEVFDYEDAHLEEKYPEFNALVQEYHDGILLFNLMENEVWNKAIKDTSGLNNYYEEHKNDYMWNDRVKAIVITCHNQNDVDRMLDLMKQELSIDSIRNIMKQENMRSTVIKERFYQKGDDVYVDSTEWIIGKMTVYPSTLDKSTKIIKIMEVRKPEPKTFKEAKGLVTSAYQTQIEKEWLKQLRKKYPVKINNKLLEKIKNIYNQ